MELGGNPRRRFLPQAATYAWLLIVVLLSHTNSWDTGVWVRQVGSVPPEDLRSGTNSLHLACNHPTNSRLGIAPYSHSSFCGTFQDKIKMRSGKKSILLA